MPSKRKGQGACRASYAPEVKKPRALRCCESTKVRVAPVVKKAKQPDKAAVASPAGYTRSKAAEKHIAQRTKKANQMLARLEIGKQSSFVKSLQRALVEINTPDPYKADALQLAALTQMAHSENLDVSLFELCVMPEGLGFQIFPEGHVGFWGTVLEALTTNDAIRDETKVRAISALYEAGHPTFDTEMARIPLTGLTG